MMVVCILMQAAMEHGECKAVIERQEQDLARLKLKHQLDIKVGTRLLYKHAGCVSAFKLGSIDVLFEVQ